MRTNAAMALRPALFPGDMISSTATTPRHRAMPGSVWASRPSPLSEADDGSRTRAKEMLFRGTALSAEECLRLGAINHVVPRSELAEFTLRQSV